MAALHDDGDLERLLKAARRHGIESDPDHESGDLIELLRAMWPLVRPEDCRVFMASDLVMGLLRDWGDEHE